MGFTGKEGNAAGEEEVGLRSRSFPGGSDCKASAYNAGDLGSIPGLGRSPGEGNGKKFLQFSTVEKKEM